MEKVISFSCSTIVTWSIVYSYKTPFAGDIEYLQKEHFILRKPNFGKANTGNLVSKASIYTFTAPMWAFRNYGCPIRKPCPGPTSTVCTERHNFHVMENHLTSCPLPVPQSQVHRGPDLFHFYTSFMILHFLGCPLLGLHLVHFWEWPLT